MASWREVARPDPGAILPIPVAGGASSADDPRVDEARLLGVDAEAVFRAAIAQAVAEAKARRWREENRKAIEAHGEWVFRQGVPLGGRRVF